jgi:hypothetical protein
MGKLLNKLETTSEIQMLSQEKVSKFTRSLFAYKMCNKVRDWIGPFMLVDTNPSFLVAA